MSERWIGRLFGCLLVAGLGLLAITACGPEDGPPSLSPTPVPAGRSLEDFAFLRLGMTYEEVVAVVGPADRLQGSGVSGYSYDLNDGTRLSLNFGPAGDELVRVLLIRPDGSREILLGQD